MEVATCATYQPLSQNDKHYFNHLDKALDTYSNYEKVLLIGDFNAEITEHYIETFLYEHELSNFVKEKTCFKNMQNPTCIDLLLTNNSYAFQQTTTVSSGPSDCHKPVLTVQSRIQKNYFSKINQQNFIYLYCFSNF